MGWTPRRLVAHDRTWSEIRVALVVLTSDRMPDLMSQIVAFLAVLLLASAPAGLEAQAHGDYAPLSLETLFRDADRIVIGDATSISESMEERVLDGVRSPFLVRKVTLTNVEVLKGSERNQNEVVIEHYSSISYRVKKGQRLLWFLGKRTTLGFDPILGKLSGDFEIVSSNDNPELRLVINRVQNRGLWDNSPTGTLWRDKLSRKAVEKKLSELGVADSLIPTILKFGDEPCKQRAIPLDLVRAVAYVQYPAPTTVARRR